MGVHVESIKGKIINFLTKDISKHLEIPFRFLLLIALATGLLMIGYLFMFTFLGYNPGKIQMNFMPAFAILLSALIAGLSMQYTISQNRKSKERDVEDKRKRAKQLLLFYLELLLDELKKQDRFLSDTRVSNYYISGYGYTQDYQDKVLPLFYGESINQSRMETISKLADKDIIGYIPIHCVSKILEIKSSSVDIVNGFDTLHKILEQSRPPSEYGMIYHELIRQISYIIPIVGKEVRKYKKNRE